MAGRFVPSVWRRTAGVSTEKLSGSRRAADSNCSSRHDCISALASVAVGLSAALDPDSTVRVSAAAGRFRCCFDTPSEWVTTSPRLVEMYFDRRASSGVGTADAVHSGVRRNGSASSTSRFLM